MAEAHCSLSKASTFDSCTGLGPSRGTPAAAAARKSAVVTTPAVLVRPALRPLRLCCCCKRPVAASVPSEPVLVAAALAVPLSLPLLCCFSALRCAGLELVWLLRLSCALLWRSLPPNKLVSPAVAAARAMGTSMTGSNPPGGGNWSKPSQGPLLPAPPPPPAPPLPPLPPSSPLLP